MTHLELISILTLEKGDVVFKIIIVQTSPGGWEEAANAVKSLGIERSTLLSDGLKIEHHLNKDQPQLLITGTIHGDSRPVIEAVGRLRQEFPSLTCLSFAAVGNLPSPPFHGNVDKWKVGGPSMSLQQAIVDWLKNNP